MANGYPWPTIPPQGAGAHEVLLVGDSLMGNTSAQLPAFLPEVTEWRVEHRNGSGLITPVPSPAPLVGPDPPCPSDEFVYAMLDKWPTVDTVCVEWAGACPDCPVTYGTVSFFSRWWTAMGNVMEVVQSRGKQLVWAISPPAPSTYNPVYTAAVSDALSWQSRDAMPGVARADWWQALAGDDGFLGRYEQWLNFGFIFPPSDQQVRADDAVHLTSAGAFRTAWWTAAALRSLWAAPLEGT